MNVPMNKQLENLYKIECFGPDGTLKWVDFIENEVVTVGLNDELTQYFKGSSYTAAPTVGLTGGTPTVVAGDTLSSHSGWTEVTAYTGSRQAITFGTASGGSISNSASPASFSINADSTTVGGAFVVMAGTVLYGAGAFTGGDKTLSNGDTLNVTVTASSTSA